MKERSLYSPLLHLLTQFLVYLALILPPHFPPVLRQLLFLPIAAIVYHIAFCSSTGDVTTDVGIGPAIISQGVIALDFVLLHDPRTVLRRKWRQESAEDERKDGHKQSLLDGGPGETLKKRASWALALLLNPRGYGWSFEPSPGILPPRPPPSLTRSHFVLGQQLVQVLICATIEVVAFILNYCNPTMHPENGVVRSDIHWAWRMIAIIGVATAAYARINILYCLSAMTTVATGLSKPQAWPNLFGNLWDAWSVNMFWSRVWHQLIRRPLCSITNTILPPQKGAKGGAYDVLRLFVLFFVSGVIHGSGEYMMLNAFSVKSLLFFTLQPVAIIVEKFVLLRFFSNQKDPNVFERVLGMIYVISWFTWTGPLFLDSMIEGGILEGEKGTLGHLVVHSLLPKVGFDIRRQ